MILEKIKNKKNWKLWKVKAFSILHYTVRISLQFQYSRVGYFKFVKYKKYYHKKKKECTQLLIHNFKEQNFIGKSLFTGSKRKGNGKSFAFCLLWKLEKAKHPDYQDKDNLKNE